MRRCLLLAGPVVLIAIAQPAHNIPERLARWKRVDMPLPASPLSAREAGMVGNPAFSFQDEVR